MAKISELASRRYSREGAEREEVESKQTRPQHLHLYLRDQGLTLRQLETAGTCEARERLCFGYSYVGAYSVPFSHKKLHAFNKVGPGVYEYNARLARHSSKYHAMFSLLRGSLQRFDLNGRIVSCGEWGKHEVLKGRSEGASRPISWSLDQLKVSSNCALFQACEERRRKRIFQA